MWMSLMNSSLVDDNAVNRKVAGMILKKAGGEVVYAKNGLEAVEQVEKGNVFDFLVTDEKWLFQCEIGINWEISF